MKHSKADSINYLQQESDFYNNFAQNYRKPFFPTMLSRRHLRIKAMQALYSYFQSPGVDIALAEKNLFKGVDKIYDLYLYFLLLIPEIANQARMQQQVEKNFPKKEDIALPHFYENKFIAQLAGNEFFTTEIKKRLINWKADEDSIRNVFMDLRKTHPFKDFVLSGPHTFDEGKAYLIEVFKKVIPESPHLLTFVEEKNIFWDSSAAWICTTVIKTLEKIKEDSSSNFLLPLFKDASDKEFIQTLFAQTILHSKEFEQDISEKTKNWEVERIALLDVIMMKMALAELTSFPSIPVKVTINEYLEIAKEYSTPGSNAFINGIVDKLAIGYKSTGKIKKTGAGLVG